MITRQKYLYRIFIAFFLINQIGLVFSCRAQSVVGLYFTASDFVSKKTMFADQSKKTKIKMKDNAFKVVCADSVFFINKDSVYGFLDKEGQCFRLYKNESYMILNNDTELVLYKVKVLGKTKYEEAGYDYYFSAGAAAALYPLSLTALKKCFYENGRFIIYMELYYRNESDLTEYDYINHKFKICRLLELSKIKTD